MSEPEGHLLSVVIPAYNDAEFIARAIASVEASTRTLHDHIAEARVEIVVVDDCSTDETAARVQAAFDAHGDGIVRRHLVRHERNSGAGAARNQGVRESLGDFIAFLDADDEFLDSHLTVCYSVLADNPTIQGVKTRIKLDEPIHPDWEPSLINSVPFNLCLRRWCHDFVGGFMENPEFKIFPCEDMMYCRMLDVCFRIGRSEFETVRHYRYPGNALDRQWEKFSQPKSANVDTLREQERAVMGAVTRLAHEREGSLMEIRRALFSHNPPPA